VFPDVFKHALVKPLLKKKHLDSEIMKNYRPVLNIAFIRKLIEKVAAKSLTHYLKQNNLLEKMQSAYRSYHSTESALLKVQNDILVQLDNKRSVLLVLLDLSAAFDTIDHSVLFNLLSTRLGIKGRVLEWFISYLSGRTQSILNNRLLHQLLYAMVFPRAQYSDQFFTLCTRFHWGIY